MGWKYSQELCPGCKQEIVAEVDWVPGDALLERQPDGTFAYQGTTDMRWDQQINEHTLRNKHRKHCGMPVRQPGQVRVRCHNGHTWLTEKEEI